MLYFIHSFIHSFNKCFDDFTKYQALCQLLWKQSPCPLVPVTDARLLLPFSSEQAADIGMCFCQGLNSQTLGGWGPFGKINPQPLNVQSLSRLSSSQEGRLWSETRGRKDHKLMERGGPAGASGGISVCCLMGSYAIITCNHSLELDSLDKLWGKIVPLKIPGVLFVSSYTRS